ncbi:MAG TPA: hypothetical protein VHZ28_17255 [Terracidiphilus sp.]|jgi:hypothetical protein|nr:hypothetical protein [Terracidiphilus sp.]
MLFPPLRRLCCAVIVTIACSVLNAQTLQQRPPAQQPGAEEPQQPASPANPDLAEGTSLQVEVGRHYPMKAGETIEGRLLHPIYANGKLVVPENTALRGKVVALQPDSKARWHARLRGDFTPFHIATVRFDEMMLPTGPARIDASTATGGAPVVHLTTPGAAPKESFIAKEWEQAKNTLRARIAYFTAPGKSDRALQFVYHQLPYHPERIEAHTAWSFELTSPLDLPVQAASAPAAQPTTAAGKSEIWAVHALLTHDLTSAKARAGDSVQALVVEPVYDKDKQLVVPQGATLVGKVTAATAARSFGRNGKLRFTFQQVQFPEGYNQPVEGSLAGAATEKTQNLSLDAEGTISPKNQSSVIAPLLLTVLAGRALDEDGNLTVNNGVASNGFGLVGRIVGIVASNRNLAAGLGYYAASLSLYENFLRSGRDVVFPRDTRIEIETTPLRAPVLAPSGR